MEIIWEGLKTALHLIITANPEIIAIILLSLEVSGIAVVISMIIGVPLGAIIGLSEFRGKKIVVALVNTGMGFPPVVVGLFVFLILMRYGPLGDLGWLYTPPAMVIAQIILASPLIVGITLAGLQGINPNLLLQIRSLGASKWQMFLTLLRESRLSLMAALAAGFGAVISEIGAVMMVGGNIKGQTRVMTTAIVLETSQGHIEVAIALGIILLLICFLINLGFTLIQQKRTGQ